MIPFPARLRGMVQEGKKMNCINRSLIDNFNFTPVAPKRRQLASPTTSTRRRFRIGLAIAIAFLATLAPCAHAQDLFRNFNIYAVQNGVKGPTRVFLTGPAQITSIATYHWNNGQGSKPGFIKILTEDAPDVLPNVPYPAQGQPGSFNVPNVNWVSKVNLTVAGGWYNVSDSDPATMSQNFESGGEGFVLVSGTYAPSVQLAGDSNIDGVGNGGTPFQFELTRPAEIDQLVTYHWNSGKGSKPGAIAIQSVKAPFPVRETFSAQGTSGTDNAPNVNWIANMSLTLPPGEYEVVDSDPATWSQNAQSGGKGFATVYGTDLSAGLTILPPKSNYGGPLPTTGLCGNPGYRMNMAPCSGSWSSTAVELVVVRPLPSAISFAQFQYFEGGVGVPSGTVVDIFTTPTLVSGDGVSTGSIYTINPPELHDLCVAGQYSKWELFPLHLNGSGEGAIGLFQIEGCP
jgi:hypothetical protein